VAGDIAVARRAAGLDFTERELQDAIVDAAKALGYLVTHFRPSRRQNGSWSTPVQGDVGFPDLVIARGRVGSKPPRLIFAELKSRTGKLSAMQQKWGGALDEIGLSSTCVEYHVFTPADWPYHVIEILRRA
jgi:hypothetical protein